MAVLPTNYLDDILAASMGGKRRFRITHEDGSTEEVTLEDVSEYEQVGSPFGSGDVNKTNQAVNEKLDSADVVDPALATVLGFAADAKLTGDALSELTKNFGEIGKCELLDTYIGSGSFNRTLSKSIDEYKELFIVISKDTTLASSLKIPTSVFKDLNIPWTLNIFGVSSSFDSNNGITVQYIDDIHIIVYFYELFKYYIYGVK